MQTGLCPTCIILLSAGDGPFHISVLEVLPRPSKVVVGLIRRIGQAGSKVGTPKKVFRCAWLFSPLRSIFWR